jgi:hypothetical protein
MQRLSVQNAGHGRLERRTLTSTTLLNDYLDWPAVGQVFCLERERFSKATRQLLSRDRHCFVTSLTPAQADPATLLALTRAHWTIEKQSHHVRDVSFHEDASQVRTGHLPHVLATLRNTTLTALRPLGLSAIQSAFVRNSARPFATLAFLVQ